MPPGSVDTAAVMVSVGPDKDMSDKPPPPPPHKMWLCPALRAALAVATGFSSEMMVEEGHYVCLDHVQMSQFLEKLRHSPGLVSSVPLPSSPLYLVRALSCVSTSRMAWIFCCYVRSSKWSANFYNLHTAPSTLHWLRSCPPTPVAQTTQMWISCGRMD